MTEALNEQLATTGVRWNLTDLYAGVTDPAVESDIAACEAEAKAIRNEYSGTIAAMDADQLLALVTRLEQLEIRSAKLGTFAFLHFTTQTKNPEAGAFLQKIKEAGSRISRETVFFELEWCAVGDETAEALLAAPVLAHYRHYLHNVRRYASHLLSQAEETLLIEKSPVGRSAWTNLFEKVMGHLTFGETGRTEEEVLNDLYHPERPVRQQAASDLTAGLTSQLHVLTHIFNTLLADKMIDD
ncbi:MAG TPA: oligoendopeptidase F, partial [Desulfurivibrionaceae bacterium]|nr:oligoendopeptidase F [Desulfurivibrionaceae bacterium]